eukprot:600259-Amphidinium_carterae.2
MVLVPKNALTELYTLECEGNAPRSIGTALISVREMPHQKHPRCVHQGRRCSVKSLAHLPRQTHVYKISMRDGVPPPITELHLHSVLDTALENVSPHPSVTVQRPF